MEDVHPVHLLVLPVSTRLLQHSVKHVLRASILCTVIQTTASSAHLGSLLLMVYHAIIAPEASILPEVVVQVVQMARAPLMDTMNHIATCAFQMSTPIAKPRVANYAQRAIILSKDRQAAQKRTMARSRTLSLG